ncbi:1-deoxy-D-xylulose-5-phosphate synthase N-terminal domain-containing protein [Candidatus Parabeggiatoa sp. HSG14]|uniref:transketolase n=1 Tax=Candidatus Parabeggiatoa sp. HSG14 TaxID=3055593 RepID=UPI0025A848BD|nr:1-deoxy-D-xylulose-5-phosphate synthase N-terminal domain-containing protein [Thiotrichales bacterium HSG14]
MINKESVWKNEVKRVALGIRRRVFEHTIKNNGGYLSQACSSADFLATLYVKNMNLGPSIAPQIPKPFAEPPNANNPNSFTGADYHGAKKPEFDRFFVSPAHYALVIYAALVETGRMDPEGLEMFNQDGSSVEMIGAEHSPGMEVTTGSLAQGLSMAAGVALARKLKKESGRVWVFLSDGELQEGQTWEAFQVIRHYNLNNLAIIVDLNGQQCDGAMESVLSLGNAADKLTAFGANVIELDGHDIEAVQKAGETYPENGALVILAKTNLCQGMDYLERRLPRLHYVRFQSQQEAQELETAIRKQLY